MIITMRPKDNTAQDIVHEDVTHWYFDYGCFHIYFDDGMVRVYPGRHIWYVEQECE